MDQVKTALAWLKEHHFWVLSLLVIGTVVGVWYTSSATLASQYKANESKIKNEFSNIDGLLNQPFKPNGGINAEQQEQVKKQAEEVLKEWQDLYNAQKSDVLIWPEELGSDFVNAVKNAKFGEPISGRRRELYQTYIKGTFPKLLEIVDARPREEGSTSGRGGGGFGVGFGGAGATRGDGEAEENYLVEWLDQDALRSRLELNKQPTALQIWVLQEDLWVYSTLLQSIANTNKLTGATRSERAAVQQIVELKVGQPAAGYNPTESRIAAPEADDAPSVGGGDFGSDGFGGGFGGDGFGGGGFGGGGFGGGGDAYGDGFGGGGAVGETSSQLLASRYLDEAGQPIADAGTDYTVFGREFKRLPVRLVLEMDSRWLSQLMWELANASMQVEIEEVRFNPEGKSGQLNGGNVQAFNRRPTHGTVVLQGIVYLFNEPDPSIATFEDSF